MNFIIARVVARVWTAVIEVEHVRIAHANAAVDEAADRAGVSGAVDGVFPAAAERQGRPPPWDYSRFRLESHPAARAYRVKFALLSCSKVPSRRL